jgi:hypothetical protein
LSTRGGGGPLSAPFLEHPTAIDAQATSKNSFFI